MSDAKPTILVIEDEPPLQRFFQATLGFAYQVLVCSYGEAGVRQVADDRPDLIILDLGLPDIDGMEVTRRIRQWSTTPIIVVSARGREPDKVMALDAGADDYITKPFGAGELLARVRVALRHLAATRQETGDSNFSVRDLSVDLSRREVSMAGQVIRLTRNEYDLLAVLVRNAGKVMTHKQLLREVWGPGSATEAHYIRVYMNQLRRKIEPDPSRPKYLVTEIGVGYRLLDC